MFCTQCGTKNPAESNFCKQCGTHLEKPSPAKISEEAYNRALPEDEQVGELLERAYHLRTQGEFAAAIVLCEQALTLRPDSTSTHSLLGQLYESTGERENAIREYVRVLELNPGSIADRVKLDELRGGVKPAARPVTAPINRKNTLSGVYVPFAAGGVIIAVLLAGSALALQLRGRHDEPSPQTAMAKPKPYAPVTTPVNDTPLLDSKPSVNPDKTSVTSNPPNANPVNVTPDAAASNPARVVTGPPPANFTARHNVTAPFVPVVSPRENVTVSSVAPNRLINPVQNTNRPAAKAKPAGGEAESSRIVLDGDNGGSGERYVIRVDANGSESRRDGGQASPSNGSASIRMANSGSNESEGAVPARADAMTNIAIANDLKLRGDYDRAVRAYQRALPTAGEEKAFVFQQIGYCYQRKGDKTSGRVNYERAVEEYQKLLAAGRKTEIAQNSIRVCERGIKICE